MNDLLSQEEIDALLKGDEDKDNNSLNESLTEQEIDALGEIGKYKYGYCCNHLIHFTITK